MAHKIQFVPFWRLTRLGFLFFNKGWNALWPNRGCDEFHNQSLSFIVPLVGEVTVWRVEYDLHGPQHLSAHGPDGWEGDDVPGCPVCKDIKEDLA